MLERLPIDRSVTSSENPLTLKYVWRVLFVFLCIFFLLPASGTIHAQSQTHPSFRDRYRLLQPRIELQKNLSINDSAYVPIGHWAWGPCHAVAVRDSFVLIGNGSILQVLFHADSTAPRIVNEYDMGDAFDIALKDTLAFAISGMFMHVFSIARLPLLEQIGEISFPFGYLNAQKIVIRDTTAFVSFFAGVLALIDIKDPSHPFQRSAVSVPDNENVGPLAVRGAYAYMGGLESPGPYMINISNVDSPHVDTSLCCNRPTSLYINDSLLYHGSFSLLQIFNLHNSGFPQLLSQTYFDGKHIGGLAQIGNILYCAADSTIYTVDISKPSTPLIRDSIQTAATIEALVNQNNCLYAAQGIGFSIIRIRAQDSLCNVSFFPTGDYNVSITKRGNLAYVSSNRAGLWILDITRPDSIKPLSNINVGGATTQALIDSNLAYLVRDTEGLWIVDVGDPYHPRLVSHYRGVIHYSGHIIQNRIAKSHNMIYITQPDDATDSGKLEIVDVSNPSYPLRRSILQISSFPLDVKARDSIVSISTFSQGIQIFNVSNPDRPLKVGQVLSFSFCHALRDSLIYAADNGFSIVNIKDPHAPRVLSSIGIDRRAPSLEIAEENKYAYLVADKIYVIDVNDPLAPKVVEQISPNGIASGITAYQDTFIAAGTALWIYKNDLITSVGPGTGNTIPNQIQLSQNYPNPFNPVTNIQFKLSHPEFVSLKIFDILGKEVTTLLNERLNPGKHVISWNATKLSSGAYFYRLDTGDFVLTKKAILMR